MNTWPVSHAPSLSRRDHLARRLVLPSPSLQSAPGRGDAAGARHCHILRDDTASGPDFARRLARKTPSRSDIWHLDERAVSTAGNRHWQWTAVYQNGNVLDEIVQVRRNAKAPKRLLTRC
ncbi:hypothetical protein DNR46_26700 [Mesorhizobium japonicum]|nr:hypothetical protein DNR46_26700 [Mesorhizobium japonicum]